MGQGEVPVPSDDRLLAASRHDPERFGVFYDRHAAAVLAFCLRRTGCVETALDLTGEVFAAAYAKRSSFRHTGAPARSWLYGIARRQIGTFHRRRRVADRYRRRFGIATATAVVAAAAGEDLDRVEVLVDLEAFTPALDGALAALPSGQQRAVQLRVVDELPYDEVARRLGCSEGAARVRVSRALTRLAETLEEP
jgi:RNA polymerase sigma factor (sigma-70 family)